MICDKLGTALIYVFKCLIFDFLTEITLQDGLHVDHM